MEEFIKGAAVLNEESLECVSGGNSNYAGHRAIILTGVYWPSAFNNSANVSPKTELIGASDLYIEYYSQTKGPAKYRIFRYGKVVGWTIEENFEYKN